MSRTMYILYSGYGIDSGFGDYAGVHWNTNPVKVNEKTVWFDNSETADLVVKELNKQSSEKFYSTGFHSSYDGNFPMEYKAQEITIPENHSFDTDIITAIAVQDSNSWMSEEFDYDNEVYMEYEDFLNERNIPMTSESYELWAKEFENE